MSNQNPLIRAFKALQLIQFWLGISNLLKVRRYRLLYVFYVVFCFTTNLLLFSFCLANILSETNKKSLVSQIMDFLTLCSVEAAILPFYYQSAMCNIYSNQRNVFEIVNLIDSEFYTQLKEVFDYRLLKRIVNKSVSFSIVMVVSMETIALICNVHEHFLSRIHRVISLFTIVIGNTVFVILIRELLRRINRMNKLSANLYHNSGNKVEMKVIFRLLF